MGIGVAVIGAGAAGLGVAAELQRRGVEGVVVLERSDHVGSSWRGRYDGLELNTDRRLSALPRHPIPRAAGSWPARDDYIAYLEDVVQRSEIDVRFGVEVERLDRTDDGWRLATTGDSLHTGQVVVATGYDRVPRMPAWPGQDSFAGELLHGSRFRNPAPYRDRDVLVVGAGNTGTEIATRLAAGRAGRVRLSFRTPVNIMPPEFMGVSATLLARMSEGSPAWVVDRVGFLMQRLAWGDLKPYGMPRSPHGIATELRVRGLGATLDRGFVAALKAGSVELVPAVEALDGSDVVLAGGERIQPAVVIAATGYRHGLERLAGHLGVLLASGRPAEPTGRAHPSAPGLYFNGFWLPLSGQLPAMRRTSVRIARAIARERRVHARRGRGQRGIPPKGAERPLPRSARARSVDAV
jgi:cation diffusion facilitator CzcD-associated flavoprotein CzcO